MASAFLIAYNDLVRLSENNPVELAERARSSDQLQDACDSLAAAAMSIWLSEEYSALRYADNIPTVEIGARRDYEKRWQHAVATTNRIFGDLTGDLASESGSTETGSFDEKLRVALEIAKYKSSQLDEFIQYNRDRMDSASDYDECPELVDAGLTVWDHDICLKLAFDPVSALARRALVPFTLVPSSVSKAHGDSEFISLYGRLADAQRAFIFGCDLSSAALQRALMEDVLQRHYLSGKMTLPARINAAQLPWGLTPKRLLSISNIGNDALHFDRNGRTNRREFLEKLTDGLEALRLLIEGAPALPSLQS